MGLAGEYRVSRRSKPINLLDIPRISDRDKSPPIARGTAQGDHPTQPPGTNGSSVHETRSTVHIYPSLPVTPDPNRLHQKSPSSSQRVDERSWRGIRVGHPRAGVDPHPRRQLCTTAGIKSCKLQARVWSCQKCGMLCLDDDSLFGSGSRHSAT